MPLPSRIAPVPSRVARRRRDDARETNNGLQQQCRDVRWSLGQVGSSRLRKGPRTLPLQSMTKGQSGTEGAEEVRVAGCVLIWPALVGSPVAMIAAVAVPVVSSEVERSIYHLSRLQKMCVRVRVCACWHHRICSFASAPLHEEDLLMRIRQQVESDRFRCLADDSARPTGQPMHSVCAFAWRWRQLSRGLRLVPKVCEHQLAAESGHLSLRHGSSGATAIAGLGWWGDSRRPCADHEWKTRCGPGS